MTLGVLRYCKIWDLTRSAACARFRLPAETSDPVEVVGQGKVEVDVLLEVDVEVSNLGPLVSLNPGPHDQLPCWQGHFGNCQQGLAVDAVELKPAPAQAHLLDGQTKHDPDLGSSIEID